MREEQADSALAGHALLETTRRYGEPSLTDLAPVVERLAVETGED